jgi:hypothetical protein
MHVQGVSNNNYQNFDLPMPQPGEIRELSRDVLSPVEFSQEEQRQLYSTIAQKFLEGKLPPRYAMIVTEPEPSQDEEAEWQVVSVMVLSEQTNFLSDIDLLIPKEVSGLEQDLLAQTWHVLPMLTCNLLQPVGRRLSREIYDVLMTVGDYYHGLVDKAPLSQEIQALGLEIAPSTHKQPKIQAFHRQEQAWSDVLTVPVAAYHCYLKGRVVLNQALQLEQDLTVNT